MAPVVYYVSITLIFTITHMAFSLFKNDLLQNVWQSGSLASDNTHFSQCYIISVISFFGGKDFIYSLRPRKFLQQENKGKKKDMKKNKPAQKKGTT